MADKKLEMTFKMEIYKGGEAGYTINYNTKEGYNETMCYVTTGPTSNCQLSVLGSVENLFANSMYRTEIINLLKGYCRAIWLIDIHTNKVSAAETFFGKGSILKQMDYISTNNSAMSIILINKSLVK